MSGRLHQISVSRGGVPKLPVLFARITTTGVEGDRQHDSVHHGGPDRAVCVFSLEVIRRLQGEGHPIVPGSVGENLTLEGVDWEMAVPGVRIEIEDSDGGAGAVLEVVSYTKPCSAIRDSFLGLQIGRIEQESFPGESRVYCRVLREGGVSVGAGVRILAVGQA